MYLLEDLVQSLLPTATPVQKHTKKPAVSSEVKRTRPTRKQVKFAEEAAEHSTEEAKMTTSSRGRKRKQINFNFDDEEDEEMSDEDFEKLDDDEYAFKEGSSDEGEPSSKRQRKGSGQSDEKQPTAAEKQKERQMRAERAKLREFKRKAKEFMNKSHCKKEVKESLAKLLKV